jgi:hypothetical protein
VTIREKLKSPTRKIDVWATGLDGDREATWDRNRHGVSCSPGAFQKPQGGKPFENPRFRYLGRGLNQRGLLASKGGRQAFDKELILEAPKIRRRY